MLNHFNFKRIDNSTVLLTNDFGKYIFLNNNEFRQVLGKETEIEEGLYARLRETLFIVEANDFFSEQVIGTLRDMKSYVFAATSLHIFVVTNACNLRCLYCQAQSEMQHINGFMTFETGKKAIDIALESPCENMTFEFQGGEPLANFPVIKQMIEYTEEVKGSKNITFTIVTNLSLLTNEILDFLIVHNVAISTSLDGPRALHDYNRRTLSKKSSYDYVMEGINKIHLRNYPVGAIQTTTKASLSYPKEIVHEYVEHGMNGLFLRPLTPLGFAKADWDNIGYTPDEFIQFYKEAFYEILNINRRGLKFPEQYCTYFLKKILSNYSINYMELRSPCGAAIGQMAYYYDGKIYTCDEARMIAESGDPAFCLGDVFSSHYKDLISSGTCRAVCASSVIETIPSCCDCVYQPYCGVCPVVNYASKGDIFSREAKTYRCRIFEGVQDFLFSLIRENDSKIMSILKSWIEEDNNHEDSNE